MLADLFDWSVIGIVVSLIFSAGLSLMSTPPPDFAMAKWCFSVAALLLLMRLGWWGTIEHPEKIQNIRTALELLLLSGGVSALWAGSIWWVNNRQQNFYRLTIEIINLEFQWRKPGVSQSYTFQSGGKLPANALFVLHVTTKTTSTYPQLIADISLEVAGQTFFHVLGRSWNPMLLTGEAWFHPHFDIHPIPGIHPARLVARVLEEGESKTTVNKYSPYFNVIIPETRMS